MGIVSDDVVIEPPAGGSRTLRGILVKPTGPGPWPGIVMIHEAWGFDDVLVRQAERMAGAGYQVIVPDLYTDGPRLPCMISTFRALQAQHGKPFIDIEATTERLRSEPDCTGRIGVIGFCMGGGFALLLGSRGYQAASVNYGMLPDDLDEVVAGSCPIVGSYGAKDKGLTGAADRLADALDRASVPHDVKEYPTAGHAFLNDVQNGPKPLRPLLRVAGAGPDPVAAADAWQRIEAFFAVNLTEPTAGASSGEGVPPTP